MYSKHEKSKLSEAFWTAFGKYLAPQEGAAGEKVNWINYKTGVRYMTFNMDVNDATAVIKIVLQHPVEEDRSQAWEQLLALKKLLSELTGEEWHWDQYYEEEYGRHQSIVYQKIEGVNLYDQGRWPEIISFFKPRIIALDRFWAEVKINFEI